MPRQQSFAAATLALLALSACTPLSARELVQLDVVDRDSDQALPEYRHRSGTWIAGVPGHRYAVRLANTSGERVLVVLSVDGVNAVTGQTAAPSQAGYVLGPWQTTEIDGWRKSLDDVARFVFTDVPDSYAARTGRPQDVGVIGIAVFREAAPPPPLVLEGAPSREAAKAAAAPASRAEAAAADVGAAPQRLGTGHGERQWAPVSRTGFERAHRHPQQISQLRYDDAASLLALGVLPRPWLARDTPQAFPGAFPGGFVADPPGN